MRKYFNTKTKILFLLPGFLLFSTFVVYPIIPCIITSMQKHNGITASAWLGFENYLKILDKKAFWSAHVQTYQAVLEELLIGITLSLLLAFMLDRASRVANRVYRFAALLPVVLSVTVVAKFFTLGIFDAKMGLINTFLEAIGLGSWATNWLASSKTAMNCVCAAYIWQFVGMNTLLFYTGIKSIPGEFYEASLIDGANFLQASVHITLPLLQDVFKYVLTGATMGTLSMYGLPAVMTEGGPGKSTRTVIYEMVLTAFSGSSNSFGLGCAIAILFLIECLFWAVIINKFVAREPIQY